MNHKTTAESYDRQSGNYDTKWQGYLNNTHRSLQSVLDIHADDTLLDVSAGTGLFALNILETPQAEVGKLVLNDVSSEMQAIAKSRLGDCPNTTFTNYSAEDLVFEPNSFNHILSLNAYHNYPKQIQFLQKAYNILSPGGFLYILDWNRKGSFRLINTFISLFTNEIINTRSKDETIQQLNSNGFEIIEAREWRYIYWRLFLVKCQKPS